MWRGMSEISTEFYQMRIKVSILFNFVKKNWATFKKIRFKDFPLGRAVSIIRILIPPFSVHA